MKSDKMNRNEMKNSLAIGRVLGLRPDDMSFEEPDFREPLRCVCGHLSTEHTWTPGQMKTPCTRQCKCVSYHHHKSR